MSEREYWTPVTKAGRPVETDGMVILFRKLDDAEIDMALCRTNNELADRLERVRVEIAGAAYTPGESK